MKVPRFRWPRARVSFVRTIEIHRKIFKNFLGQNHFAQMLKSWFVSLFDGPLPSLFKQGSQDLRGPCARGPSFEP